MIFWATENRPGTFDFAVERLSKFGGDLPWYPGLFHKYHYGKCIEELKSEFPSASADKQERAITSFLKSKYFGMLYEDLSEAIPADKVREVAAKIGSDDPQARANLKWLDENYAQAPAAQEKAEEGKKIRS